MNPYEAHKALEEVQACITFEHEKNSVADTRWQILRNMVYAARKEGTLEAWKPVGDYVLGIEMTPIPDWYTERNQRDKEKGDSKS